MNYLKWLHYTTLTNKVKSANQDYTYYCKFLRCVVQMIHVTEAKSDKNQSVKR